MLDEHKIEDKIKITTFIEKVKEYGYDNIESTDHTFKRISQKQRKIYTEEELKKIIFNQKPIEVGMQKNKNYAVLYSFKENRYIKILLDPTPNKLYIVTFYILNKEQEKTIKDGKKISE